MNNFASIVNKTQNELKNSFDNLTNENFELKNQINSVITVVKKKQKYELSNLKSQINSINLSIGELKKEKNDGYNRSSQKPQISELKYRMKLFETTTT